MTPGYYRRRGWLCNYAQGLATLPGDAMARTPSANRHIPPKNRRAERRLAIIEAAARLFAEAGYDACEMERVAAEQGIAKGTLYLYFSSKEELFYACVDHGMSQMQASIDAAVEEAVDEPLARISGAIRAYLRFFEEHPQYAELLIQERANFRDRKRPTYFEYRDASRGRWREIYTGLRDAGRIRDDLPIERILDTIGNLLYGTMFTNHFIGRAVSLDEQHRTLMEILFRGLWSDSERQRHPKPADTPLPA